MKWIKLLSSAHVAGLLRHPHEGVLHLSDEEGDRLVENGLGEDVSADFTAKQDNAPADTLDEGAGGAGQVSAPANPHQSEVAPQATTETTKPSRKAAAQKE